MSESSYKKVPISEKDNEKCVNEANYGYGVRHIQGILFFLSLATFYMARGHLGVSIVAMTDKTSTETNKLNGTIQSSGNITADVREYNISKEDSWSIYTTYNWPKSTQEIVLGSFFLGYSIMMFPGGIICQKFGGMLPLKIGMLINAIISILTPWIVAWGGWKALSACRLIQGLTQAGLYPAIQTLLSNWVPIRERASFSGYVYTGPSFGTVIAFQLGGILAYSHFGWPSVFWLAGVACFVVFFLLTFFGAPYPAAHKTISDEEKNYIVGDTENSVQTKPDTPWKSILTSIPTWATFIAHIGSAFSYVFFYVQVPTYMNAVMKVDIRSNGILSSLPYISVIFASILFGYLSNFFTNRKILSLKYARNLFNTISSVFPAICMASVSFTTNTSLAVVLFVLTQATHAAMFTGWVINYMDLSPNYSGALMALGNTIANIILLALPVLVSYVVQDVTNQYQWRTIMFVVSAFAVVANIVFVIFMSADVQPWNDDKGGNISDKDGAKLETIKESTNESVKS